MGRLAARVVAVFCGSLGACGADATATVAPVLEVAVDVAEDVTVTEVADIDERTEEVVTVEEDADNGGDNVVAGGCGGESFDGRCEGSTIVYCESPESGVATIECAPDFECGVKDGYAECRVPGSAGCGGVTYEGYCDGNVAIYCNWEITEVVSYDCGDDGMTCGYVDDETGYYCVGTPGGGVFSVRGSFLFEKPAIGPGGLGAVGEEPVRNAIVQVRTAAADELIATGVSDETGAFEIAYDQAGGDVYAVALAAADDDRYSIFVRDCPLENCDGSGYVHAVYSESFTPAVGGDIGGWVASRESSGGAFNVLDVFMRGQDFAWRVYGSKPPTLTGQWEQGSQTTCGELSCFSARSNSIFVLGLSVDTDEFDDPVLAHEFGHYLEAAYSRSDSPGGSHDGSPTDPRLAWSEGYGTFAGCELMGSPIYVDTAAGGASVTDISDTGFEGNPSGGLSQLVSEYLVAEILWIASRGGNITGPMGSAVLFDVLGAYFPTGWLADRGVQGVDLVDFLDGLMCRGSAREEDVRRIVVSQRKFPYDFGGPGSCR